MADGLNEARALRVSEITTDYQDIQRRIAHYEADPPESDYHEIGYAALRQCHTEARALLNANYPLELLHPPSGPGEAEKRQLQRVIIDASARRFQAQKIYLRATAAMKWINQRNAILHGQKPQNGHLTQLHQADNAFRAEITNVTDQRIINALRTKDQQAGYYLSDDPTLPVVLSWISSLHEG